jgi:hypothetical protein
MNSFENEQGARDNLNHFGNNVDWTKEIKALKVVLDILNKWALRCRISQEYSDCPFYESFPSVLRKFSDRVFSIDHSTSNLFERNGVDDA